MQSTGAGTSARRQSRLHLVRTPSAVGVSGPQALTLQESEEAGTVPCGPHSQFADGSRLVLVHSGPFLTMRQEVWPAGLDSDTPAPAGSDSLVGTLRRQTLRTHLSPLGPRVGFTVRPRDSLGREGRDAVGLQRAEPASAALGSAASACQPLPLFASADFHVSACMADSGATMAVKPTLFLCRRTASPSQSHRVLAP